jgi:hypothetical protein
MIRHERVDNYFQVTFTSSAQKLLTGQIDALRVLEVATAVERAHRKEDALAAAIRFVTKSGRSSERHRDVIGKSRSALLALLGAMSSWLSGSLG